LLKAENLRAKEVLLLRSRLALKELPELLQQGGARVDDVPVYDIVTVKERSARLVEKIAQGQIDWLTFASPSSAKAFFEEIPRDLVNSSSVKVASIGPVTSEQARKLGVRIDVEASEHTIDGLLEAIERYEKP
jgi:uroporphyrinogen III methyltransferase/synthase